MGKIKMLNLFRCSSTGDKMDEEDIHYFVTDYFDGIKVEELDIEATTLAECLGIKRTANKKHIGVSHQRYCLYSNVNQKMDIFDTNLELPMLTIIQVFINPDVYQADVFTEDGKDVSSSNCINKAEECIREYLGETEELKWQVYRLLTAGDFAVIVRSKRLHDAYNISTIIRNICMTPQETDNRISVFFTYSISGVLNENGNNKDICSKIDWNECLNKEDRVVIRVVYSQTDQKYGGDNSQSLALGHRLLGRYDYQIECTPSEFQELYPYIRNYKFGDEVFTEEILKKVSGEKAKSLLNMIIMGQILRINEKILLHYEEDPLLTDAPRYVWEVSSSKEWISLYERNAQTLLRLKNKVTEELEDKKNEDNIEKFYPGERNLKEYVRLLGRFCRVLHEINQMRELRISTANLSKQLEIMLDSLKSYIINARANQHDIQATANKIDEYLRLGIGSLEIFARYIRNINLQTLQTPNYDLQTNICIEKILLAYSQFLRPFLVSQNSEADKTNPYYLSNILYPIVVPNMGVKDLSVCVLFNGFHLEDEELKEQNQKKLLVVNSPTFSYLCETCFFLPTIFHEIAHQFRYESHEERNNCLEACLLKGFIYNIILELLDEERNYEFYMEEGIEKVVDSIYQKIKGRIVSEEIKKGGLQLFKLTFEAEIQQFLVFVNTQKTPVSIIKQYMEQTKRDVRTYSVDILEQIDKLEKEIQNMESILQKDSHYDVKRLLQLFKEYFEMQENQIFEEIKDMLIKYKNTLPKTDYEVSINIERFCSESWENIDKKEKGQKIFDMWGDLEKDNMDFIFQEDLKNLLKHYHSLYNAFIYTEPAFDMEEDQLEQQIRFQNIFEDMCTVMHKELFNIINKWDEGRKRQLKWEALFLESEKFEPLKRWIKFEKKEGIEKKLKIIFSHYQGNRIEEFLSSQVECYTEVTSDLFMCSMMGLESFGYLVVAAENFVFHNENELMLYKRISLVLQCLSKKRSGINLTSEDYSNELLDALRREIKILQKRYPHILAEDSAGDVSGWKIESIEDFLNKIRNTESPNTTQDWILRMLLQISCIIYNISDIFLAGEIIGDKEIWKDIVSDNSYIEKKKMLPSILKDKEGITLLNSIAGILNSPASYYDNKKYLLTEEIEFILLYYEKNCKEIFK